MPEVTSTPNEGMTEGKGTTAILFPETVEPAETETQEEKKAVEPEQPKEPEVKQTDDGQKQEPRKLTEAELDALVLTKVDGVEEYKTLREVLKGYQTDQHLSRKGQKLSQDRLALEEMRKEIYGMVNTPKPTPAPSISSIPDDDPMKEVIAPYLNPIIELNKKLEEKVKFLEETTQDARYQSNLKMVDRLLKGQGYSDFMEYVGRIEEYISGLDEEAQKTYNTPTGFYDLYKDMKLKDVIAAQNKPKETVKTQPTVPPVAPKVEGNQGTGTENDDWIARYNKLMERAKKSGSNEDWGEILRLKGII